MIMNRLIKKVVCVTLMGAFLFTNCVSISAADKDVSYSEIMADEIEAGATTNIDIEAEEIFGGEKASTNINSNTKKTDSSAKTTGKKSDKTGVDDTPKTGMEDTSILVPVALLFVAAVALAVAGVSRFGRKRFDAAD